MNSGARVLLILLMASAATAALWWGARHLPAHWWRDDVIAEIRGEIVTVSQLETGLRQYLWQRGLEWEGLPKDEQDKVRDTVLQGLLRRRILRLDRVTANGAAPTASEVDREIQEWRRQFQPDGERTLRMGRQQVTDADIEKRIHAALTDQGWIELQSNANAAKIDEAAAREWYHKHAEDLRVPPATRASHLYLTRHERDKPNREPEIQDISRQLATGGATFAELCAKFSEDERTKARGGDLGWFTADRMPKDFMTAVDKLAVGQTSEPVLTELGWHILRVNERKPSRIPGFEEVRHEIEAHLLSEARRQALERALESMMKRHEANLWRARDEKVSAIGPAPIH